MFNEIICATWFYGKKINVANTYCTCVKPPNKFSQYFNIEYCAQAYPLLVLRPRGSHLHAIYSSACEEDQSFDRQKRCLITWLFSSEALENLIFKGWKVKLQLCIFDPLILAVQRSPWSLDQPPKGALVAWFNFDPSRIRFYMGHISDYPL